jgi:hypothetical protein
MGMRVVLDVRAATWAGEPEGDDNWVRAAFLIDPRDYPAAVLGNAWDMTEASSGAPAWYTMDIDSVVHWSSYTDSIGGMFEGGISSAHIPDNRLYLNMPSSSMLWIDGNLYNRFSITGKTSLSSADIVLGWVDSHDGRDSVEVGELTTTYGATPVFDLAAEWAGKGIKLLWLGFRYSSSVSPQVRIGGVELIEAEQ